jgi:lipopolysaccharide heptosyltransferase II
MEIGRAFSRSAPRRVCLIKPSSLGDVVHATPVFQALRALWPTSQFTWVVNRGLEGLLEGLPGLDRVLIFDRRAAGRGLGGAVCFLRFLAELRKQEFDLAIDLQGLLRSGLMALSTGAAVRVGLAEAREGARHFYTHRVPSNREQPHAVDRLMSVARFLGAPEQEPRFAVACPEADRLCVEHQLAGLARPRLVLNLGARWPTKRWPPESFAQIAIQAFQQLKASIIVVGAPEDSAARDAFKHALGDLPFLDLCGATTLPQLAAVSRVCDLFLSNDTGPMHVAAASGARVLGVFTCTSPEKTGPYGARASVVRSKIWCAGSLLKTCSRMECMSELRPQRVWNEVKRLLAIDGFQESRAA